MTAAGGAIAIDTQSQLAINLYMYVHIILHYTNITYDMQCTLKWCSSPIIVENAALFFRESMIDLVYVT